MTFKWIKRFMPRSLFGRAVLILLVPIVALQLIVATKLIQRHFDGVTRQLAEGVALNISVLVDALERDGELDARSLDFARTVGFSPTVRVGTQPDLSFKRLFYDISGRVIQEEVEATLERPTGVDLLSDYRRVTFATAVNGDTLTVTVRRSRVSASNPHQLLIVMVVSSLILTIISLIFLRNQIRPIGKLAAAAEAFGKGRAHSYRPSGADDVRRAGTAFLAMRSRLERQIEQRTLMLSGVSHDLRTPLTRMKLALATAEDVDDIRDIEHDVQEMEKMLEEFLSFARGDSEEMTRPTDPFALADEIAENTSRSGISLDVVRRNSDPSRPLVQMREMAIRRAIQNLIGNASRFGTKVRLTIDLKPRSLTITVEDNGPGIAAENIDEAMRPFARLDAARNQNEGGAVGLGLAITKDIAGSHGGSLHLENSEEMGGLRAVLTIPR